MFQRAIQAISAFLTSRRSFPFFLLLLCIAAYGLWIPWLGFYWDDFPLAWIAKSMGGSGLTRYFATNRPFWGLLYQLTTPILGASPLVWQISALLLRCATGIAFWALLRAVWQRLERMAAFAAALFVVYPGFSEQSISLVYSHFYIILTAFLLSLLCSVWALKKKAWFLLLTVCAWILAAVNLLSMEYFFLLELLRPMLLWAALQEEALTVRQRLTRVLRMCTPYLLLFIGAMVWRTVFGFHTYQPGFFARLKVDALPALFALIGSMVHDLGIILVQNWGFAFTPPAFPVTAAGQYPRYALVMAMIAALCLAYWLFFRDSSARSRKELLPAFLIALFALLLAGGPFWLTDLPLGTLFPNDRFSISFLFGACLLFAVLLEWLPLPRWSTAALLSILIAASVGLHFGEGFFYRADWSTQTSLFQQMLWRMPALQPGTTLLSDELDFRHYTDNSLSAPLNWVYDPQNDPARMKYILFYPSLRKDQETWLSSMQKGLPIQRDYLATTFYGNTSQVISFSFNPPGCFRVLDPEIDPYNWSVSSTLKELLPLSNLSVILSAPPAGQAAPHLPNWAKEQADGGSWCYYFEKADLARQLQKWDEVAALGDKAFAQKDYPNDPVERLPFIEGYAHLGNWQRALALSHETRAITPAMAPVLCRVWDRIDRQTTPSPEKTAALRAIAAENACVP